MSGNKSKTALKTYLLYAYWRRGAEIFVIFTSSAFWNQYRHHNALGISTNMFTKIDSMKLTQAIILYTLEIIFLLFI